jgi:hypothetical protein
MEEIQFWEASSFCPLNAERGGNMFLRSIGPLYTRLHGIFQKTVIFIVTVVRIADVTDAFFVVTSDGFWGPRKDCGSMKLTPHLCLVPRSWMHRTKHRNNILICFRMVPPRINVFFADVSEFLAVSTFGCSLLSRFTGVRCIILKFIFEVIYEY